MLLFKTIFGQYLFTYEPSKKQNENKSGADAYETPFI
jgi:hypothetical protein